MSDQQATTAVNQAAAAAQTTQTQAANKPSGQTAGSSDFTMTSTISSLEQLKEKAPEVYKQMMLGIASQVTSAMERSNDRIKKKMRENRDQ